MDIEKQLNDFEEDGFIVKSRDFSEEKKESNLEIDTDKYYGTEVDINFAYYHMFPDSLLTAILNFDLNSTQIKLILLIHKETLGFYSKRNKNTNNNEDSNYPMSRLRVSFGGSRKVLRSRFIPFSVRNYCEVLRVSKSSLHRHIQDLCNKNLIQYNIRPLKKSYIGLNYHTIELNLSGYITKIGDTIQFRKQEGVLDIEGKYISRFKDSVETILSVLGRKVRYKLKDVPDKYKTLLRKLIKKL